MLRNMLSSTPKRAGPFGRAHGPEYTEGLPGKVVSFDIVSLSPAFKGGACGATGRSTIYHLEDL